MAMDCSVAAFIGIDCGFGVERFVQMTFDDYKLASIVIDYGHEAIVKSHRHSHEAIL